MQEDKESQLNKVAQKVRDFHGSELYEFRKQNGYQAVFGEGDADARVMLIGEAPGEQEAKSGRPFVGRAGQVLDELLESIGVKRDEVYITNIVKDRPPENRNPRAEEIELYMPFLDQQLRIVEPTVIVTLGSVATETMLRQFELPQKGSPLGDVHGVPIEAHAPYGDVTLLPMYHPAAAFYNSSLDDVMKKDIKELQALT